MATDRTGQVLVTAGYDKTIRVWSLPAGRQIEVLRPPIGLAQEGEIYAVAITPDGKRVFAAGATGGAWDGTFSIYIFDVAKGSLVGLLPGLAAPVEALSVSPDGTRFAAGLARGGIASWDAGSGALLWGDASIAAPVRDLVFDHDNRLFVSAADGKVRAYGADGRPAGAMAAGHPWGLALSPDESLLAVADSAADKAGRLHLAVLSTRTLATVFAPDTAGLKGEGLLSAAWVGGPAGTTRLLAGGYAHDQTGYVIRSWADFGLGPATDLAAASDTVLHILRLPGGGAAYATEDPGWGLVGPDGALARLPTPPMADVRPSRGTLAISADGQTVSYHTPTATFRFSAGARTLTATNQPDPALAAARISAPGLALSAWQDSSAPRLNGTKLALGASEFARSAAVLPDGKRLLLGTDTQLRLFDARGQQIAATAIPAAAWALAVAGDGGSAVAALRDGTVRWYGLAGAAPLAERAALFADPSGARWVLFTPDGFFDDGAGGGNELVGLLLNRARNQQPAWLSFSQAYRTLYAPAVVAAALRGDRQPAATRLGALGDLRARIAGEPTAEIDDACLPAATGGCAAVSADAVIAPGQKLRLHISVHDHGLGAGQIDAFVNGRNVGRSQAPVLAGGLGHGTIEVPLDPDRNSVQLRVYDPAATIFTETKRLEVRGAAEGGGGHRLFVLALGIDHFALPSLSLRYAVADADSVASLIQQAAAPVFSSVNVTKLTDAQATRAGILKALDDLAGVMTPDDTFIFYVASHGVRSQGTGRFLLIPQDIGSNADWNAIESAAIDETTLIAALARIQARDALLLLDTCHAGEVTADNLANIGHETGRYLLAAASSEQEALDSYDNKNGVLVYALREALQGQAAHDNDGTITALALGEYIAHRVGVLARQKGGGQDAVFSAAQRDLESFPVARVMR